MVMAYSTFLCALASSVPQAIAINIALGLLNVPNYVGRCLAIQRNTTREVRGRVNSAFLVVRNLMYLLGMEAGGLADVLDVRWLLIASSLLNVIADRAQKASCEAGRNMVRYQTRCSFSVTE